MLITDYSSGYRRVDALPATLILTEQAAMTIPPNTKLIPLTQGKFAIVDAEDYEWLSQWKWQVKKKSNTYYARRSMRIDVNKRCSILMHQLILPGNKVYKPDHINGNGLDNRRLNLRLATQQENTWNKKGHKNSTSKFKGVSIFRTSTNIKWRAAIRIENRTTHIGLYPSEEAAAKAYDEVAKKYYGEFAYLNFAEIPRENAEHGFQIPLPNEVDYDY